MRPEGRPAILRHMIPRLSVCARLLVAGISGVAQAQERSTPAGAEIVFLDVGQGDAILIRSDTFNVLIDAGNSGHIMRDLLDRRVRHIHLLIASHNHDDHIGDMDDVVRNMPVDEFVDNTCHEVTRTQSNLLIALRRYRVPRQPDTVSTRQFGAMILEILPSPFGTCDTSQNNLSIGVVVRVGAFTALLTGDSETYEQNAWAMAGLIPDVDVLKAAHHGAENGAAPYWLQEADAEVVVISVGVNSYGHPAASALRRYAIRGKQIYRTDEDGSIEICIAPTGTYKVLVPAATPGAVCQ
jgi:competence protein ComEC